MEKVLVVVDMQNDFIDGALGTSEAVAILPRAYELVRNFQGEVIFTRDTHSESYLDSAEGKKLPVPHCIKGTDGWEIASLLDVERKRLSARTFDKITFGSRELADYLYKKDKEEGIEEIVIIGICTDICVISNAMLIKAALPEIKITVDSSACAGVTPESHRRALEAMKMCQIDVL